MTQMGMLIYGLVYLLVAFVFGTFTIFLFFKLFNALIKNIDDMQELRQNNIAVGILNSALILAISLFISESIQTAMEAFKNNIIVFGSELNSAEKWKTVVIMLCHYVMSLVIAFIILWFSIKLFTMLTRNLDEFSEIKKNNQAVAILLAVVIISMSIVLRPGVGKFLKGVIDYPIPQAQSGIRSAPPIPAQGQNSPRQQ